MQSLIPSPLGLVTNSLLILAAWDWGQAAAGPRAALGLVAIPELGKAAASVLGDCGAAAWPWNCLGIFCGRFLQQCKWLTV